MFAAHASKYQLSQVRGLIFQSRSVAKMENIIMAIHQSKSRCSHDKSPSFKVSQNRKNQQKIPKRQISPIAVPVLFLLLFLLFCSLFCSLCACPFLLLFCFHFFASNSALVG